MKHIFLAIILLLAIPSYAQDPNDSVIFNAMNDEMERNIERLSLPNESSPFFISYTLGRYRQFTIQGSLGSLISSRETPWGMSGSVQLLLGSYHRNSNMNGIGVNADMPNDVDYEGIRRGFWVASDLMYKASLQVLAQKTEYLQNNTLSPEEDVLNDWQQLPPTTSHDSRIMEFRIDMAMFDNMVKELSAIFLEYPEIYNSSVSFSGVDGNIYKVNSEGTSLKQPTGVVSIHIFGMVNTPEGSSISDRFSLYAETPDELISLDEMKVRVRGFADGLLKLKDAPRMDKFYTGPVMFEGNAVASIFGSNLIQTDVLLSHRSFGRRAPQMQTDRFNGQIIDKRISVKNYTAIKSYNGEKLSGGYAVDAEGVTPPAEITLVDRGIFKSILNCRIPAINAPKSTGSSRFIMPPSSMAAVTAPGIIHIQVEKPTRSDKMREKLLKMAKSKGLPYAYIIKSSNGPASLIYRIDVKTGEEIQVRAANIPHFNLQKLMKLEDISDEERVDNYIWNGACFSSLIYPSAFIVDTFDINTTRRTNEKSPVLKYPLQR